MDVFLHMFNLGRGRGRAGRRRGVEGRIANMIILLDTRIFAFYSFKFARTVRVSQE